MKNIFLVFGAHDGSTIPKLDKIDTEKVYGKKNIVWDEIHLFEPQPDHVKVLQKLEASDSRIKYHNVAVSIEDAKMIFHLRGGGGNDGSTLDPFKTTGKFHNAITVNTINIIEWIKQNTNEDDFVVIDMDIECEEYKILPVLMKDKICDRIQFISIEFHANKSSFYSKNNLDIEIYNTAKDYFGSKLLSHNKYFG